VELRANKNVIGTLQATIDKINRILGNEQLAWLQADLAALSASTPVVLFARVPLFMVYS
jgi:phosphodiesterase/alkaline phosphatase D-like protein